MGGEREKERDRNFTILPPLENFPFSNKRFEIGAVAIWPEFLKKSILDGGCDFNYRITP